MELVLGVAVALALASCDALIRGRHLEGVVARLGRPLPSTTSKESVGRTAGRRHAPLAGRGGRLIQSGR